jgi:hypothetical protein
MRPLSRSWLHTFRSFTRPRSLLDCLVDRFGKPLRRFNALAPLDARLSSRRNAIVSCTRVQVCHVLDSWLRHHVIDFLARQRAVCRLAELLVAARRRLADSFAV